MTGGAATFMPGRVWRFQEPQSFAGPMVPSASEVLNFRQSCRRFRHCHRLGYSSPLLPLTCAYLAAALVGAKLHRSAPPSHGQGGLETGALRIQDGKDAATFLLLLVWQDQYVLATTCLRKLSCPLSFMAATTGTVHLTRPILDSSGCHRPSPAHVPLPPNDRQVCLSIWYNVK